MTSNVSLRVTNMCFCLLQRVFKGTSSENKCSTAMSRGKVQATEDNSQAGNTFAMKNNTGFLALPKIKYETMVHLSANTLSEQSDCPTRNNHQGNKYCM